MIGALAENIIPSWKAKRLPFLLSQLFHSDLVRQLDKASQLN